jgi:hypothetical protein
LKIRQQPQFTPVNRGILNLVRKTSTFTRHVWLFKQGNFDLYREKLNSVDWDEAFKDCDVNTCVDKFNELVLTNAKSCIPNKTITVRQNDPPWLTCKIKKLIRKRKRSHKKAKKKPKKRMIQLPGKTIDKSEITASLASENLERNTMKKLSSNLLLSKHNSKAWWNNVNKLLNKSQIKKAFPPIVCSDTVYENDKDKTTIFNDYFCEQTELSDANISTPSIDPHDLPQNTLYNIYIQTEEIEDVLASLDVTKATGPDQINPILLKEASSTLCYPLCKIFNMSLENSIFPEQWKKANVIPVHKKDETNDVKNYRPISLLCIVAKVMERQGSKLTFQPASQARLIDCNFCQSAEKLFSPPHIRKIKKK